MDARLVQTALDPGASIPLAGLPPSATVSPWTPSLPTEWQFEEPGGRLFFAADTLAALHEQLPAPAILCLVQRGAAGTEQVHAAIGGRHDDFRAFVATCARVALVLAHRLACGASDGVPDARGMPPIEGGAHVRRRLRREERWLSEQWACGIAGRPLREILASGSVGPVEWLEPDDAKSAYFADPFGWPGRDDRILCERVRHATGVGDLVWIERGARPTVHPLRPAAPTHRSYPLAWREGEAVYVMPESFTDRITTIHRLRDDGTLEPRCTIAQGIAMSDATLFRAHDRWWIAYTDSDLGHHDNLCLLMADDVEGPWRPHPLNPVKIDLRSSRCGGTVFELDGAWYRPAQDCSLRYGGALVVHRILELTSERYREEPVAVLRPDPNGPYPHGLHTLSAWGERTLVDGKRMELRARSVLAKIARKLLRTGP